MTFTERYRNSYQGQKVHLFHPSVNFLAEAQPRLENNRRQKARSLYLPFSNR
jgi:hypothetical protein